MGTDLTYNGVILQNVRTLDFVHTIKRDNTADVNTDFHKVNIAVETLVSVDTLQFALASRNLGVTYYPGMSNSALTVDVMAAVEKLLVVDRKDLVYSIDGRALLRINGAVNSGGSSLPQNTYADANNGPRVGHLKLVHVTGKTIRIQFEIEAAFQCCCDGTGNVPAVVSNRWGVDEAIDERL